MQKEKFNIEIINLFEIDKQKYGINKQINLLIDFDSISKLKLLSYLDEKKKKINIQGIDKLKTFLDIYKLINKN